MKTPHRFLKSSVALAASGLAAGASQAEVLYSGPLDLTLSLSEGSGITKAFDLDGDLNNDYEFVYANNNANKPQITTTNFNAGGTNQIILPDAAASGRTLPVLDGGVTIDASLYGGVSLEEAFFYQNWDSNYYGDWAGPGGATAPDPVTGPITGYIGLKIGGGEDWNYGFAHFTVDVPAQTITLLDTGYETELNTAVVTPVPEPATVALLALGASGLTLLRRRSRYRNA